MQVYEVVIKTSFHKLCIWAVQQMRRAACAPYCNTLQRGCSEECTGKSPKGSLILPAGQGVIPVRLLHAAVSALDY